MSMARKVTSEGADGRTAYRLRMAHWHGGVEQPAGTVIALDADQVERVRAAEEAALGALSEVLAAGAAAIAVEVEHG